MKLGRFHIYLGRDPDAGLSVEQRDTQRNIRETTGPHEILGGLLSVGGKSRRKILDDNRLRRVPPPGTEVNSERAITRLVDLTYRGGLGYTGARTSRVEQMRQEGMNPAHKQVSAADRIVQNAEARDELGVSAGRARRTADRARRHMYFTLRKSSNIRPSAATYAVLASDSAADPPKLARVYFSSDAKTELGWTRDRTARGAWHTGTDVVVPPGYVLPSKTAPFEVTAASDGFMREFNGNRKMRQRLWIDTVIGRDQAAQMLRDRQTPSPQDEFPRLRPPYDALDFRFPRGGQST